VRVVNAVACPPRQFITAVVLLHVMEVAQGQHPAIVGLLLHSEVTLAVVRRRRPKMGCLRTRALAYLAR
jgi:hypothetical protein